MSCIWGAKIDFLYLRVHDHPNTKIFWKWHSSSNKTLREAKMGKTLKSHSILNWMRSGKEEKNIDESLTSRRINYHLHNCILTLYNPGQSGIPLVNILNWKDFWCGNGFCKSRRSCFLKGEHVSVCRDFGNARWRFKSLFACSYMVLMIFVANFFLKRSDGSSCCKYFGYKTLMCLEDSTNT